MKGYISGATGFLGKIIAQHFFETGNSLIISGRSRSDLEKLRNELIGPKIKTNQTIDLHVIDYSKPESFADVMASLDDENIDWCINAVGEQGKIGPDIDLHYSDYLQNISVNLFSAIEFTRYFSKAFKVKKNGKIIHFSGGGSANPRPYFSPYSVSKTALVRYVENTAIELFEANIQIFLVAPGLMPSKMIKETLSSAEYLSDSEREKIKNLYTNSHIYSSQNITNLLDFLLSVTAFVLSLLSRQLYFPRFIFLSKMICLS